MSAIPIPSLAPVRVLLLEDADIDAHVIENVLGQFELVVRRVSRLSDAITALRTGGFDVILCDLGLPDSSGLATLETLREHGVSVPVVVMTGRGDRDTALRAVAAGAQDYLVKGNTDANALVRAIRYAVERNASEARFRALVARYELILNGITDGVLGVDPAGNIVFENPAGAAMLGWRPAELIGRSLHQTVHHSTPESESSMHRTLADGSVECGEDDIFQRKDGSAIRVEYTAAPMVDEQGRIAGAVVTFRDISKQKQMEQQIEQGLRVASLGRVSASVAHEFNNLLMSIGPSAECLRRKAAVDPALEKPVKHVLDAVRRGQRLTDEILRFTNPPEPRMRQLDLAVVLREFRDAAHGILTERRMEIEMPAALEIRADADQLTQVLLNLVANARNATRTGGTVTIGAAPAVSIPFLREQLPDAERFAALYVRDDGCGISAEAKQRIFEPFFTTRKCAGTGLGLAVAFRIVSQHGGHTLVDSEVGTGSTFYIALPR